MTLIKKHLWISILPFLLPLAGCELTEEDKEKITQLADQIIITYPANEATVVDSIITVRSDIPASADAQEVTLYVDGVEVAKDSDGAPWEISWPAYYWADGEKHTLLLKTLTGTGVEVRNTQEYQVTVSTEANKALSFGAGLDGTSVKDVNSVELEFAEFPGATSYEISYSANGNKKQVRVDGTNAILTDLDVGEYLIQYRAIKNYTDLTTFVGPWSSSLAFEIAPPGVPKIFAPEILEIESTYNVTLSWEDLGSVNTYNVYVYSSDQTTLLYEYNNIDSTTLQLEGLNPGKYFFSIRRVNHLNQRSELSEQKIIEAGVFTRVLGGSGDEVAIDLVMSKDGGYFVLGSTNSSELSSKVRASGSDWVIKLNSEGVVEWDYIHDSEIGLVFKGIAELSDGSVVLVGRDWQVKKAVALKIDSSGEVKWSVSYRPDGLLYPYEFLNVVEFNGEILVSSAEWGRGSCNDCITRIGTHLHQIGADDGNVSDYIVTPNITGVDIKSIDKLLVTSTGDLVISGFSMPTGELSNDEWLGGAYFQVLDSEFSEVISWNNIAGGMHYNVGDITELSDGKFAVIGGGQIGEPYISVVSEDGSTYSRFYGLSTNYYYDTDSLVAGANGKLYAIFGDSEGNSYPYPLEMVKLSSELSIVGRNRNFYDDLSLKIKKFVAEENGFFAMISDKKSSDDTKDIVLSKLLIE